MTENLRKIILQQSGYKNLQITKPSGKQQYVFYKKTFERWEKLALLKMEKIFLMILNYEISLMFFSNIFSELNFPKKSIILFWMIWIQIQFSSFSRLLKITQALIISKVKSQMNDIPTRVIKTNKDIHVNFIMDHFN